MRPAAGGGLAAGGMALLPAAGVLLWTAGCTPRSTAQQAAPPAARLEPLSIQFANVAREAGITFRHDDCRKGMATMMEQAGPGVAALDYDGDGWQDLYFLNGRDLYGRGIQRRNALYRNKRDGTFEDVTLEAGVPGTGYGQGAAAGDFDNDGDTDLYLCQYGPNVLYRNDGGRFTDITAAARVDGMDYKEPFHTGATWVDYDRDGLLDLFVGGYVKFHAGPRYCPLPGSTQLSNCPPSVYEGTYCILYRNLGGGRFRNVTKEAGCWLPQSKALTCMVTDVNDDGWPDIFVGNDGSPAFLLRNERNGRFAEVGFAAGVAVSAEMSTMAAMGVDFGDYRNDGRLALFVADFQEKPNHLFENDGAGLFTEVSDAAGIGQPSVDFLKFGGGFVDYDNDGWLDLFWANGHVYPEIDKLNGPTRYKQHPQLFRNRGDGTFEEVTSGAGPAFAEKWASRGAIWLDLWNRGVQDIVVANNSDPPALLKHPGTPGRHWLSLRLVGRSSCRDAIGARVVVEAGGIRQTRIVRTSYSYLSSSDTRLHFGLGRAARVDRVEIRWPGGREQSFSDLAADAPYTVEEGAAAVRG